jgi:hypothetical protein
MTKDDELFIINGNIAHYEAMLKLDIDDEKRLTVERLLAEAKADLAAASKKQVFVMPESGDDPGALRKLASWYRELSERAGNPTIWDARLRTAEDLEAEANRAEAKWSPATSKAATE